MQVLIVVKVQALAVLPTSAEQQCMVAAMINGVMNAPFHNGQQVQFPLNDKSTSIRFAHCGQGSGNASRGASVYSEVTFDHFEKPM